MSRRRLGGPGPLVLTLGGLLLLPGHLRAQQQGMEPVTVDSVVVLGNQRVSDAEIVNRSGLRPGRQVRFPEIQASIHDLFETGDFADVEIRVTRGEPAIFYIVVEERPYVFEVAFQGLTQLSTASVRDSAGLPAEGPLNPAPVERTRNIVRERLARRGFPRAAVDTLLTPLPGVPGYRLTFRVDEGPRLGIVGISFQGNEAFSDARLRSVMQTGEEGFFWWQGGGFRRDVYQGDLSQRLPDFYASHGYIDFSVLGDTVIVDRSTGKGRIEVRVREGPQYRLADFEVVGNRRFPTAELRRMYAVAARLPGDTAAGTGELPADSATGTALPPFDRVDFESSAGEAADMYRNNGFLRASVEPVFERVQPEAAEAPPQIRARWQVSEGEPAYVRHVRIEGNTHTYDRIIRERLSVVPGDVYSQQRLINSIQRVQGLGFFEQIPPQEAVQIENREDGDVDITLRVKEKHTGNLNFGMSAAAITGLAGFIGYDQPNLFGQAKSLHFRWLFGSRTNDVEVSYSDPAIFGSDQSLSVSLLNSRDIFRTFSIGTRRQIGGSVEVGTPVFDLPYTRAFVGYSLFREELGDLGTSLRESAFLSEGTRSSANFRVVRDTRNSTLFPTDGSRNFLSVRFTGGPLGGDGEFGKYEFESSWHVPVAQIGGGLESNPIEFSAGIAFRGGFILGDNPFFRERFFMGGVQFGEQLRGYEEATITPQGHLPRNRRDVGNLDRAGSAYFSTTTQLGAKLTNNVLLSAFVDGGNVWRSAGEFNPSDLLMGAGVGATLVTPFGPLGIDYAYGFNRRDVLGRPDPGWKLHFKFGRIF